ncbi:MAG: glucokinase [Haliea sp.]|nr:glucokinase [Haliea sp.]MDP5063446.1 glucokinase [Haliea sp.]
MKPLTHNLRLVADVGGTHTRIACFDPSSACLQSVREYENRHYAGFKEVLKAWFAELQGEQPVEACIAVAAALQGDEARMSNISWHLRGTALAQSFKLQRVKLINDFQAIAYAVPWLCPDDCVTLQHGAAKPNPSRLAVFGPGTGLGGAVLEQGLMPSTRFSNQPLTPSSAHRSTKSASVVACEPGQMDLAPRGELQGALWAVLQQEHSRIYAELLLSGPGLRRIYAALCIAEGCVAEDLPAAEISARALAGSDALCVTTLAVFCDLLGAASANFVVATGTFEALYLAGGILPKILPLLEHSSFLERFQERGPLRGHLAGTGIAVIRHPQPGLLGAAHVSLD